VKQGGVARSLIACARGEGGHRALAGTAFGLARSLMAFFEPRLRHGAPRPLGRRRRLAWIVRVDERNVLVPGVYRRDRIASRIHSVLFEGHHSRLTVGMRASVPKPQVQRSPKLLLGDRICIGRWQR
jgi:hypothetical protein